MPRWNGFHVAVGLALALCATVGCQRPAQTATLPDYDRQLPPGGPGLRKVVDPTKLPDLKQPFRQRTQELVSATDRSLHWFGYPSTPQHFPVQGFSHEHVFLSTLAFRQILVDSSSAEQFEQRMLSEFDVWQTVGWNGRGDVLFTGYYTPIFAASRQQTQEFRYPLYRRPPDLVSDPQTGEILGRRSGDTVTGFPTRAQIDGGGLLRGLELVWMRSKLDAYLVHVQGSARLTMRDGSTMYIGYAGNNGHDYVSISQALIRDGKLDRHRRGLAAIRAYFRQNPENLDRYLNLNPRYIFFKAYSADQWPAGSLGFRVTARRSLATDKSVFPRAAAMLASTVVPDGGGGRVRFDQFMLDQDTGGAIRAPGRADIYFGIGPEAEHIAGQQYAEGTFYYFLLKPQRVEAWRQSARGGRR